jgi:GTP-binding protein
LFNRLLRRQAALVDDLPGATRDRQYSPREIAGRGGILTDTGGYGLCKQDRLSGPVAGQALAALEECDLAVMVVDGALGLHPEDRDVAALIRKLGKPSIVAVNKVDGPELEDSVHEFQALGLPEIVAVSAAHGFGVRALKERLFEFLEPNAARPEGDPRPRLAVIGRPNAGKSSLVNRLTGSGRLVVDERPGTTRDPVDVEIEAGGQKYVLVDTAGVRRRGRVSERLERASALRALKSVDGADAALLMVDAAEGLSDQDAHIAGFAFERGRPVVILLNKWDLVRDKARARKDFERERQLKMSFLESAPFLTVSALSGRGLAPLFPLIDKIMAQFTFRAPTSEVNRAVEAAQSRHSPPQAGKVRLKFYYAAQVATRPPSFALFANRPKSVHFSYQRFLKNSLKKAFGLDLVPVRLFIRARHEDRHSGGGRRKP